MTPFAQKLLLSAVFVAGAFAALVWSAHTNKAIEAAQVVMPLKCTASMWSDGRAYVVIGRPE